MRDRTQELLAIAERLGNEGGATSTNGGLSGPLPPRPTATTKVNQSEFAKKASRIGQAIHSTSNKLARLAQLAKRTSMFDDPAQEIQDLTLIVKQDITGLNRAIEDLQQLSAKNKDGSYNKQSSAHSTTVVDNLRTRLKDTTKSFKDVLTLRTENLKNNQNRRKMFSSSTNSPFASRGPPLLPRNQLRSNQNPNANGGSQTMQPHMEGQKAQAPGGQGQSMQSQLLAPQEDSYMDSRADALRNVESTIVELGGIFEQLAHMVQEQGEMAVRIDENVDETVTNVEGAQAQLMKYYKTISSNRWLAMKVFSVLLLFAVLFIVFMA
ncbi:syntaxin [Chloropicon primus]|uniref:Syntaxin n=1 Tax=Chloropicon primus TaxID=1764295 RepID=A0A5B8MQE6_9CHLO|nr:syntaxin [Chloropicon primus]UPR00821.1 syntaxin [Chloropicon primus]|mmetsp:Transcript_34830/g.75375  ORF Transcript_34830/g.75375 Transcript_34830/m.75375 type:complete len:323 (+) Transcript_34830:3-971(+)|eukprot:QDZ21610.1 syntaxin [Chloropicon primus]